MLVRLLPFLHFRGALFTRPPLLGVSLVVRVNLLIHSFIHSSVQDVPGTVITGQEVGRTALLTSGGWVLGLKGGATRSLSCVPLSR